MKKTTQELLDLMKNSTDFQKFLQANKEEISTEYVSIAKVLNDLLAKTQMKRSDVISRTMIDKNYAYQIFSGQKTPNRDKVLMLLAAFDLGPDEVQSYLRLTGYPQLYGRNLRDSVILFGLTRHLPVMEVNLMLEQLELPLLSDNL
ncbi:MAG: hypothetical protein MJ175_11790 [Clostridia bacterium]|nr:hypothetical protein [Clostridia bacterium]